MPKVFIIIPCYNEALNLNQVINSVKQFGQVIVVDDGSTDNSTAVAKSLGVVVLRHLINRGQGAALQTGHEYARKHQADLVIHFDADGQHQAADIKNLLKIIINEKVDVVLGSRFLGGSQVPVFKKWLILKPAIIFQNFLLGLKLTDAHNGLRALSRKALERINLTQDGMAHATEIIEQIKINNLSYREIPVTVIYRQSGQGFLAGLKIILDLFINKINK